MEQPTPRRGHVVTVRSVTASLCVAKGTVFEAGSGRLSLSVRSEWWTAPGARVECRVSGPKGVATFTGEVLRELPAKGLVVVAMPEALVLEERRRHRRRRFTEPVEWAKVERGRDLEEPQAGRGVDLSVAGLAFHSVRAPSLDHLLAVNFSLSSVEVTAIIRPIEVRPLSFPVHGQRFHTRGEIVAVTDDARSALASFTGEPALASNPS